MGILVPLVIPLTWAVMKANGYSGPDDMHILYSAIASVLAGSVWGDHCSPISDTTILSSMASGCDHIEHVRTQLPYALLVGRGCNRSRVHTGCFRHALVARPADRRRLAVHILRVVGQAPPQSLQGEQSPFKARFTGSVESWSGLHGSSLAIAIDAAAGAHDGAYILIVTRSSHQAQLLARDLELLSVNPCRYSCFLITKRCPTIRSLHTRTSSPNGSRRFRPWPRCAGELCWRRLLH